MHTVDCTTPDKPRASASPPSVASSKQSNLPPVRAGNLKLVLLWSLRGLAVKGLTWLCGYREYLESEDSKALQLSSVSKNVQGCLMSCLPQQCTCQLHLFLAQFSFPRIVPPHQQFGLDIRIEARTRSVSFISINTWWGLLSVGSLSTGSGQPALSTSAMYSQTTDCIDSVPERANRSPCRYSRSFFLVMCLDCTTILLLIARMPTQQAWLATMLTGM